MSAVEFKNQDGVLSVALSGRIDTTNAPDAEKEIDAIRSAETYSAVQVDAEKLEYISSAGLRVLLRLRKNEPTLKIVNASAEVYDILDMTGFTEMIPVEKAYRKFSVEGCPVIGKGAKGTVYRYDPEIIVKVYNNPDSIAGIKRERELARKAFVLGIPTAISYDIVTVDGLYGSVFELLDADSMCTALQKHPEKEDAYTKMFADLLRQIHETDVKEDDMPDARERLTLWVEQTKDVIPASYRDKLQKMIEEIPKVLKMQHGDYHMNNVMMQNGEPILIDMDTLSYGHPIIELANVFVAYEGFSIANPKHVEDFLNLPAETCSRIWRKFIPYYLGTDDPERIRAVDDKARLLGYLRVVRHVVRRGIQTEEQQRMVDLSIEKMNELITRVDSFLF